MDNRLQGKVAVVTGAGRGIARAVALLLTEVGASVVVNDLGCEVDGQGASQELADAVVKEIQSRGGNAGSSYELSHQVRGHRLPATTGRVHREPRF